MVYFQIPFVYEVNASSMFFDGSDYNSIPTRPDPSAVDWPPESAIDPQLSQWSPSHGIERYLDAPPSVPITTLHHMQSTPILRPLLGTAPVPAPAHGRQCSPVSQNTSSASSALSPPSESDRFYDTLGPSTPQDTTMSPTPMIKTLHSWDYAGEQSMFSGMTANICVDPREVNSNQETVEPEKEPDAIDFSQALDFTPASPVPRYEISRQDSHPFSSTFHHQKPMSSDERQHRLIEKESNFAAEQSQPLAYPSPTFESKEESPDADELQTRIKAEEDDHKDNDYEPTKSVRKNSSGSRLESRSIRKRSAPSFAVVDKPKPTKRTRLGKTVSASPPSQKSTAAFATAKKSSFACTDCQTAACNDKHAKQPDLRPFPCVFGYAGCTSTFASKNEWKRHTVTQHLVLHYWLCTQGACAGVTNTPTAKKGSGAALANVTSGPTREPSLPNGAIFNRKDLYTQHVRRMHMPPQARKAAKQKKPTPEWDERLRLLQAEAQRERCALPVSMACPASGCGQHFHGPNAWDERMEHVARHLDKAAAGEEPEVVFGGDGDPTLTTWVSSANVNVVQRSVQGAWMLVNPLRSPATHLAGSAVDGQSFSEQKSLVSDDDEMDAEGEDDD